MVKVIFAQAKSGEIRLRNWRPGRAGNVVRERVTKAGPPLVRGISAKFVRVLPQVAAIRRPAAKTSIDGVEVFFLSTAFRADPFIGQISKSGSRLYAVFVIALGWIVNIAAGAFHFLHVGIS
jgi:hypothetical protein